MCEFARNGDLERIKMLCSLGCNVNAADYDGRTCLHVAASAGNKLIVSALLEAGGELSLLDHWEGTPLSDAVRQGHRDIANRLIEGGATLSFEESRAAGELCELARSGDLEKVKLLLSGGCAPDSCDYDKRTCLHLASSVGNHHIVQVREIETWVSRATCTTRSHAVHTVPRCRVTQKPVTLYIYPCRPWWRPRQIRTSKTAGAARRSQRPYARATLKWWCTCAGRERRLCGTKARRAVMSCASLRARATSSA